ASSFRSTGHAGRRIPPGGVGLSLEMRARPVRLCEIRWVYDFGRDDEERVAVRHVEAIEVLRHDGIRTVGNAVPAEVARLHFRRDDLERSAPAAAGGPGEEPADHARG